MTLEVISSRSLVLIHYQDLEFDPLWLTAYCSGFYLCLEPVEYYALFYLVRCGHAGELILKSRLSFCLYGDNPPPKANLERLVSHLSHKLSKICSCVCIKDLGDAYVLVTLMLETEQQPKSAP